MLPEASVEENIVVALARSKEPLTHYQLWKKHKVAASNKTVLTTLSRLEKKHMVNSRQEKKGRKRKFYELTFFGLIASLTYKWAWQLIDEIAEAKKNMLPLVFGKWAFFKKEHILEEIIGKLKLACYQFWKSSVSYKIVPETISSLFEWKKLKARGKLGPTDRTVPLAIYERNVYGMTSWREMPDVTSFVLGISDLAGLPMNPLRTIPGMKKEELRKVESAVDGRRALLQVLRRDPDLKNYLDDRLRLDTAILEAKIENVESWRNWTQSVKSHPKRARAKSKREQKKELTWHEVFYGTK